MRVAKEEQEVEEVQSRFSLLNFLFLFIAIVFIGSGFFIYNQIYKKHINTELTRSVSSILPLPAGSVNSDTFFYKEVFAFDSLAKFDEPDQDHFGEIIDAIVRQSLIKQIAKELNIIIDPIVADEDQWSQYGWTKAQYEEYVLEPLALAGSVDAAIYGSTLHQQSVIDELEHIIALFESGITFEDLAVQYSENASGQFGGDVGYSCVDDLDEELVGDWYKEVDLISPIIEFDDSFVLATAYDRIESEDEEACVQIGLQMITLYKNTLADVLVGYKEAAITDIYGQ